jgi:predicted negative regulator of RcsB-dependent stress response
MAAYDLEEQEKLDALKDWWRENRSVVLLSLLAGLLAFGAVKGWRAYKQNVGESAAVLYDSVETAGKEKDVKKIASAADVLKVQYPASAYAARAALVAAKASFEAKDSDTATTQLKWVAEKAADKAFRNLARLRLAGVLLDQKKYDEALKMLDEVKDETQLARVQDLRGDIFAAQAKLPEARAAYKAALAKEEARSPTKQITQMKLDVIGDDK